MAIVTGAGSGIGRAIALEFAKEGADVAIAYSRNDANAQESGRMVEALGRKALVSKSDVSDAQSVRTFFDLVANTFGRMDILVNNAGVSLVGPLLELSEANWDRVIDVDLKGTFLCTKAFAHYLSSTGKGGGKIINIGSVQGTRPWKGVANYAAAKGGLINLTRELAVELAEYGINVNLVSPGAIAIGVTVKKRNEPDFAKKVETEIPLKRMGLPEEVAHLVLFLASKESDYITGAEILIDGGLLLHPFTV